MLAKLTLYDGTVYRFASKTVDTSEGLYLGRLKDELSIVSAMQEAGNAPSTINLTIINYDNFIPRAKDLWAAELLLTNDNNVSWKGKVNFCNFDADGNLYITASEKTAPELELQLPDEVRQVYTVDENFHQSSTTMTIPLVIGGTSANPITLSTILIDKTEGVYLVCVGEIRQIVNVYNGTELLPANAYTAYTGTASQSEHPGFAYIKLNEGYRTNLDGSYAEINVDVVGLKLGSYTAEECRNGARFLYYFLTTQSQGINGWGCGIDPSEIDQASFNAAITLCDQFNFKLDGIMWLRQSASSWIDQICQAIHGKYSINANGKRSLFIDYAGNASKKTFNEKNMKVDRYGKNSYTSTVYNKGILSYAYNPITGLFMQSAQYENAASIAQIGEQKFIGESYLIKDATTALAVLEYVCKRSQSAAEAVEFSTDDTVTTLRAGDIITIDRSDIGISGNYQISSISTTDYQSQITAVKFDTSVFSVTGSTNTVAWTNEKNIVPALTPAEATNLLLSTGFDINPDGTGNPYISGTFTVPDGGWLAAAVQYGIGASPTNYTELALITEGKFKIQPVSVGTVYTVRIRMITATGHSDYITGQITSTGDSVAPAIPTIAVNATDKSVIVQCAIDNPPYDMGGFQIHRKKHSESVYTLIGNVAANRGYASFSDYVDDWVAYDYKAKSYDRSGNLSDFSEVKTVTVTGIQANDISATALRIPTGSILRLSAKGCTTASIKQTTDASGNPVYGVKDVSGYNRHGQAFGEVTVLDGGEGFEFRNGYILTKDSFSFSTEMTYVFGFSVNSLATSTQSILDHRNSENNNGLVVFNYANGAIGIGCRKTGNNWTLQTPTGSYTPNTWHQVTCVFGSSKSSIYIDGILAKEGDYTSSADGSLPLYIGKFNGSSYSFAGKLKDVRIYPRALSATEVKSMYMLPDEAVFGQLNADLIGANVIKASNLVMTEAVISNAAQIDQAVVNNLNVSGNATFQAGLNGIQVGGRNLIKDSATAIVNRTSATNDHTFFSPNLDTTAYFNSNRKADTDYVVSFDYDITGITTAATLRLTLRYTSSSYSNFQNAVIIPAPVGNSSGHVSVVTKLSAGQVTYGTRFLMTGFGANKNNNVVVTLTNIKMEEGNKATDWTPAPEDVEADIASGDSATLASAKTYAEGKASTAQSNAEAAAAAALAAVTNNIYYGTTTKIDGGVIQTGSIGAAAIAANSITADKISVTSQSKSLVADLSIEGLPTSLPVGTPIPNKVNTIQYKVAGAAYTRYFNSVTTNGWCLNTTDSLARVISSGTRTRPASFSVAARWRINAGDLPTMGAFLFDSRAGSSNNSRIIIFARQSDRCLAVRCYSSDGSTSTDTVFNLTMSSGTWRNLCFVFTGTVVKLFLNGALSQTLNLTTEALSACSYCWGNSIIASGTTYRAMSGYLGYMKMFDSAISDDAAIYVSKNITNSESGLVTADRISTSAIKSRNYQQGGSGTATSENGLAFSAQGSFLNLDGGSYAAPKFRIGNDGSCQIGHFTITDDGFFKINYTSGTQFVESLITTDEISTTYKVSNVTRCESKFGSSGISSYGYTSSGGNVSQFAVRPENDGSTFTMAPVVITPKSTSNYGLNVAGKIRINGADVTSDREVKKDFKDVSVLNSFKRLKVQSWRFDEKKIAEKENIHTDVNIVHQRNIGCMAQDFNEAFGTNPNAEDCINVTDAIGVSMRAIQELAERNDELIGEVRQLKRILRSANIITDQIIAEDRDNEAIRRLEIAKARQAKREAKILANNSENENAVIEPIAEDEILANNPEDEPTEPQLDDEPTD